MATTQSSLAASISSAPLTILSFFVKPHISLTSDPNMHQIPNSRLMSPLDPYVTPLDERPHQIPKRHWCSRSPHP